jgi:mRNA interferase RelE/StbE
MSLQILINKTFLKELAKLPTSERQKIEKLVFNDITRLNTLDDIPGIKKLKGYHHYYRIRFGNYRAGIKIQNNRLVFERLLHRKDIYKFYP